MRPIRLGVNIDHVATLRNARGGIHPDPLRAARAALAAGADSITLHLREDRRHIRDEDVLALKAGLGAPINLEMAVSEEMIGFAERLRPHAVCFVPEKRAEITTEGGLEVGAQAPLLARAAARLGAAGCRVSFFIDPERASVLAAAEAGARAVELHTGAYCHDPKRAEFERLKEAAQLALSLGLECHAGHGLDYDTARKVASIEEIAELNIGHFLIGEALFEGLDRVVAKMAMVLREAQAARKASPD